VSISGQSNYKDFVEDFVPRIHAVDDVYGLFQGLGYPADAILDPSYKRRVSEFGFAKEEEEKIANIYTVLSIEKNLNVFLVETKSPANVTVRFLRYLAKVFSDHYLRFLLIVTGDFRTVVFVLPDFEKKDVGELKLKIIRLQVDVTDLYYTDKQTITNLGLTGQERDWRDIWLKWRDAFNVRRVTDKFFEEYAGAPDSVFFKIRKELVRQKISRRDAHEFTLQFLNRVMFVYFVAKKRWLNNEPRFMRWLWQRYLKERNNDRAPVDSFYEKWLKTIFFEAFNNKFTPHSDLPEDVNRIFYTVPYLNGGLFREEDIDRLPVKIKDSLFQEVFEFFERYNFTIREDLPFDLEVAVDPQMIGYVYESLANVAEEIYDRNDLGIFYTPRVEVDFMCRRALVEYLHNHMPKVSKELWYRLVFDEDTESVEKQLSQLAGFWYDLEEKLDAISIVDPACGSGAFLVGMLNVLTSLYKVVNRNLGRSKPDFEIKKRIVGKSLYGVDVMPWAVHAAELRLWLQLVVESPLEPKDLRTYPLLPNLNMNLRVGDSLVQEIGDMTLHLRDPKLSEKVKKKLLELKQEKENYINNVPTAKFKRKEEVEKEEIRIFQEITEERLHFIENQIKNIRNKIKGEESQKTLSGEEVALSDERRKRIEQFQKQIELYNREEYELKKIKENLAIPGKKPLVWEIDFAEIFGNKNGFDIVIGNPPYVPYKEISPPNVLKKDVTKEQKKQYKDKLIASVKTCFDVVENLNGMSDYYLYFYFHGLSLLNKKGTFCFITSNFWLDVDYGKELQEFLFKYVPIIGVYDCSKRSFEHALINTVIALFGAPQFEEGKIAGLKIVGGNGWPMINNTAKFVMFRKPFEEVLNARNLIDIENIGVEVRGQGITQAVKNVVKTSDYMVFPVVQEDLLEDGWEYPEEYDTKKGRFKEGSYAGNKLGGKYLRAPDIFFRVLTNGKIVKLGKISKIKTGLKESGYKDYIKSSEELNVKQRENFLPILKNVRQLNKIEIKFNDSYIIRDKRHFTKATEDKHSEILWLSMRGEKHICYFNPHQFTFTGNFFGIEPIEHEMTVPLLAVLNSTLTFLMFEILARKGFGGGSAIMVKSDLENHMVVIDPKNLDQKRIRILLSKISQREIYSIFNECGISPEKTIRDQEPSPLPDRAELDEMIFDELGLTENERKEVYWSVCELVKNRIEKATSLGSRKNA